MAEWSKAQTHPTGILLNGFKSSQVLQLIPLLRADLEAREYLVLYNVVMCISPLGAPHLYKALTPGVICDPGIALQKIKCILINNYRTLHFLDKII